MRGSDLSLEGTGGWLPLLRPLTREPWWDVLQAGVEAAERPVYPPGDQVFAALTLTQPETVRVVILGQDPYHGPGQAMGLSFSVPQGMALPPSLKNIFRELAEDLSTPPPPSGDLTPWARQGVLLLNSVLTVTGGAPGSHAGLGWERFTDGIIRATNAFPQPIAFLLWGNYAGKKAALIQSDAPRLILRSAHPSPLSARRGFFGSRPFSQVNAFLRENGEEEIRW